MERAFDNVLAYLSFERSVVEVEVARLFFATPRDLGHALKNDAYQRFMLSAMSRPATVETFEPSAKRSPGGLVLIGR